MSQFDEDAQIRKLIDATAEDLPEAPPAIPIEALQPKVTVTEVTPGQPGKAKATDDEQSMESENPVVRALEELPRRIWDEFQNRFGD